MGELGEVLRILFYNEAFFARDKKKTATGELL